MRGIYLFTFKGIPVAVNPMYLLLLVFLGISTNSVTGALIFALCATFALLVHEFGHGLVSARYGLNPQILLHGFGGLTFHGPAKTNGQDFRITAAGPAASLILGLIFLAIQMAISTWLPADFLNERQNLMLLLKYSLWVNLGWGIFNLVPVLPMDGGKLLLYTLRFKLSERRSQIIATVVSLVVGLAGLVAAAVAQWFFMIILVFFMLMMNFNGLRALLGKTDAAAPNREAEALYEQARDLARRHEWEKLETTAQQMKRIANGTEQVGQAYELLVIANTNLKNYKEALEYVRHAPKTTAVIQAEKRCVHFLELEEEDDEA